MSHHQFEFRLGQTSLKWLPGKVKFFISKIHKNEKSNKQY